MKAFLKHLPVVLSGATLAAIAASTTSHAADISWILDPPAEGLFSDSANWEGSLVPTTGDTAILANGGTAQIVSTDVIDLFELNVMSGSVTQNGGSLNTTNNDGIELLQGLNVGSLAGSSASYTATDATIIGGAVRIGWGGGTGSMTMSGNSTYTSGPNNDTWLGNKEGSVGTLTLEDSTIWTIANDSIVVGRDGGTGTLTMTGESQLIGMANMMYLGTGVGAGTSTPSNATINVSDSAVIDWTGGNIVFGLAGAHTTATINGVGENGASVIARTDQIWIGQGAGSVGIVNVSGTGRLRAENHYIAVGREGGTGTLNISGDAIVEKAGSSSDRHIVVGDQAGSNGTIHVFENGQLLSNQHIVVGSNGGTGLLTVDGNATVHANGEFWVGARVANSVGTLNLNSGQVISDSWIALGRDQSKGTINMTGGELTHTGTGSVVGSGLTGNNITTIGSATNIADFNQSGGTVNNVNSVLVLSEGASSVTTWDATGGAANLGDLRVGFNGLATLTLGGTASYSATSVYLSSNSGSTGHLVLNGGTFAANFIEEGAGDGTIAFNGGTVKARMNQANYIRDFEDADVEVQSGGLKFDTNTFEVTISHNLSGAGGLTKQGAGTLALTGVNTFTGDSFVEAGTLVVSNVGLDGAASLSINIGATLDLEGSLSLNDEIILRLDSGSFVVLNFDGTETIGALWINGSVVAPDQYTLGELQSMFGGDVTFTGNTNAILEVTSTIPEPGTVALLAGGIGIALLMRRRIQRG